MFFIPSYPKFHNIWRVTKTHVQFPGCPEFLLPNFQLWSFHQYFVLRKMILLKNKFIKEKGLQKCR